MCYRPYTDTKREGHHPTEYLALLALVGGVVYWRMRPSGPEPPPPVRVGTASDLQNKYLSCVAASLHTTDPVERLVAVAQATAYAGSLADNTRSSQWRTAAKRAQAELDNTQKAIAARLAMYAPAPVASVQPNRPHPARPAAPQPPPPPDPAAAQARADAITLLRNMGLKLSDATQRVDAALASMPGSTDVAAIVKASFAAARP
jgi:hypothetical protein